MRKLIIFSLTIMFCGLILGNQTWASSFSSTAVTFKKAVHFMTPDGSDVVVEPGIYEVAGTKTELQLTRGSGGPLISLHAQQTPFPEDVDSPVAMAIPISEAGVYIALVMPNAQGLEAMGSYSGIHTRGRSQSGLRVRQSMNIQRRTQLNNFASQLRKNPRAPKVTQRWKQLIQPGKTKGKAASPANVSAVVVQVLRQAYLETTKDLQSLAAKIKANNEKKKQLREQIKKLREKKSQAGGDKDKNETLDKIQEQMEQALQDLEAQDRQTNFEIQVLMSQYNQAEQAAAAIRKKQEETEKATIKKIQ